MCLGTFKPNSTDIDTAYIGPSNSVKMGWWGTFNPYSTDR
jgi:hypothetical protein